jgi:acyl-CoA thioesterase
MDTIDKIKNQFETSDLFPKSLGIELLDLAPGYARVTMKVCPNMINLHGIGHGGVIFSVADTALGLACNAHGITAVGMTCNIDYLAPAILGEQLVAIAQEQYRSKRIGNYQITVSSSDDKLIALVRGIVYFKVS